MNRKLIFFNGSAPIITKTTINKLIVEINKLNINKSMKQILLISSLNLLSSVKTSKALTYQLENFKNHGKITFEKTNSKYIHNTLKDIQKMSISDFTNTINNLINFLISNNIVIKI